MSLPTSSDLYKTMSNTATTFLESWRPNPSGSNISNKDAILSTLTPSFHTSYGHKLFVSTAPMLQGARSGAEFADRTAAAGLLVQTWDVQITDLIVDESKRTVVARGDFSMTVVPGQTVLNDLIVVMKMNESGEKLVECVEFPDPTASAEIQRVLTAGS